MIIAYHNIGKYNSLFQNSELISIRKVHEEYSSEFGVWKMKYLLKCRTKKDSKCPRVFVIEQMETQDDPLLISGELDDSSEANEDMIINGANYELEETDQSICTFYDAISLESAVSCWIALNNISDPKSRLKNIGKLKAKLKYETD